MPNNKKPASLIGLVILLISMIASVQANGSFIPDIMMIVAGIIILVSEKSTLNESGHQ